MNKSKSDMPVLDEDGLIELQWDGKNGNVRVTHNEYRRENSPFLISPIEGEYSIAYDNNNNINKQNNKALTPLNPGSLTTDNTKLIHVIDKEFAQQFQGREKTSSIAKIQWLKNRKAQIFGFCTFLITFGLTLALYNYRWTGLIAGSLLTIFCNLSIMVTYYRKKEWHQHPNPIMHSRGVLGFFLAICFLNNVIVNYNASDSNNKCLRLSIFTEFFFFTSEAWALVLAYDLFLSLTSPFVSYKRMMRIYHLFVWGAGFAFSIFIWSHPTSAGFFRVDGRRIGTSDESHYLIGFCLATSQRCYNVGDSSSQEKDLPSCIETGFWKAQIWPWIFIYIFVIIVLLVSIIVLIIAWHRLYLRGVRKTYNIRLGVLNYISFFTGAYVIYWLLVLILYMSAYFMSTRAVSNSENEQALVIKQIVMLIICCRGYLDYVIWFAVNSIQGGEVSKKQHKTKKGDVDIDLSPQVNTALRSEIIYYTISGIKQSLKESGDLNYSKDVICIKIDDENSTTDNKVKFWSYSPYTFKLLRKSFGIDDSQYLNMLSAITKERFSEGRSGAFMFFTSDESLIIKTISYKESDLLQKLASKYSDYLVSQPNSLLTRFYGCHAVSLYGKTYSFVVMGNIFASTGVIHLRYDIKGSWVDRNATYPKKGKKAHCRYCNASYTYGSSYDQECPDGLNFHEPGIVLKDNDMLSKIRIDSSYALSLFKQIDKDSSFLCSNNIMDYSLLIGVQSGEYIVNGEADNIQWRSENTPKHEPGKSCMIGAPKIATQNATSVAGPAVYHFGIIDFLQQWNSEKKLERFYKTHMLQKDPNGISALPPIQYLTRFKRKMARIFAVKDPDLNILSDDELPMPRLIDAA